MAGDWIVMRTDLANDPAVVRLADICGISRQHVVGCLHAVWSWFDQQTVNGDARSVTFSFIDELAGVTGFAQAMSSDEVRWLETVNDGGPSRGMRIPNFDVYMSQNAKRRLLTARRMARRRAAQSDASVTRACSRSDARSVTSASPTEEKRRDIYQPPNPLPHAEGGTNSSGPQEDGAGRSKRRADRHRREAEQLARVAAKLVEVQRFREEEARWA